MLIINIILTRLKLYTKKPQVPDMKVANENNITYTVADGQKALAEQMERNRQKYRKVKTGETVISDEIERAQYLRALDVHYEKMRRFKEESMAIAIARVRNREERKNLPTQPMEIKTRWLQQLANNLSQSTPNNQ